MLEMVDEIGPMAYRPESLMIRRASLRAMLGGLLAVVLLLVLGEVATRVFVTSPSRQIVDPEIGFRYVPHSVMFQGQEGSARLRLNSFGFNEDEVGPKGARKRVVVVGDSMTESLQVEREANYVSRLEHLLPDVEFINAARSDAGPLEYRAILNRVGTLFDPEFVLFAFSFGDLEDIRRGLFTVERGSNGEILDVKLQASRQAEMKSMIEPIIQRSALATLLMRRFGSTLEAWRETAVAPAPPKPLDDAECAEILTFVLRDAAFRRPVVAVFLPQFDYMAGRRSRIAPASAREAAVLAHAAEQADAPFLVLQEGLAEQYQAAGQPGHGFSNKRIGTGHLNPAGHRAVAHDVAGFLRPALFQRED